MNNTRKFAGCIFLAIIVLGLSTGISQTCAGTRELHPVFDARLSLKTSSVSAGELSLLKRTVFPVAERYWKRKGIDCERELQVIDVAQGSFTRGSAKQRAVLYKYCTTGHNFALDGIAVIEDNRVAAHVVYEGAWDNAIGALPDINGNGLSEIIIATGGMNMGEVWESVSLIEIAGHKVDKLGRFETFDGECEAVGGRGGSTAHRIWSSTGPSPFYERETFVRDCIGGKWKRSGMSRIKPGSDEINYVMIK